MPPVFLLLLRLPTRWHRRCEYARRQSLQACLSLAGRNAGLRPADHAKPPGTALVQSAKFGANDFLGAEGHVKISFDAHVDARKARLQHAQNLEGMVVERDIPAQYVGAAAVLLLPESVTQDGYCG